MRNLILCLGLFLCLANTGCAALIDAAFRETADHGDNPRYEQQSFGSHFLDALAEDDDEPCHTRRTTVYVSHHHH